MKGRGSVKGEHFICTRGWVNVNSAWQKAFPRLGQCSRRSGGVPDNGWRPEKTAVPGP